MKLRNIITNEVIKGSATGTLDDLESPQVEPGTILEVTHIAVENRTTAYTRLVIGVADGLSFYEKEEEDSPAADNIYWTKSKFLIPAGKKLRARLTGCSSGDDLHMTYEGFLWRVDYFRENHMTEIGRPPPHKLTHQDAGRDEISVTGLSGLLADDQHVLDTEVLAVAAAKTHGTTHFPNGSDPVGLPKFSANKNGVDQVIGDSSFTKVTFGTEVFDVGGAYDAVNSRWVPGIIGIVQVSVETWWDSFGAGALPQLLIYLNGTIYRRLIFLGAGTGNICLRLTTLVPIAAITDYIEAYVYQDTGINRTITGDIHYSWFEGHVLG